MAPAIGGLPKPLPSSGLPYIFRSNERLSCNRRVRANRKARNAAYDPHLPLARILPIIRSPWNRLYHFSYLTSPPTSVYTRELSAWQKILHFFLDLLRHVLYSIRHLFGGRFTSRLVVLRCGEASRRFVMNRREWMRFGLVLIALVGLLSALQPAWAQEVTASIVGTITDPSGAPIANADVAATDNARGVDYRTKTNDVGAYTIQRIPVGNYTVKASAQGFRTAVYPAFTLVLNQTARIEITLKVGQRSETVEVTGTAPLLQTETAMISSVVDSISADKLPLATRNYVQLTLLSPGAVHPSITSFNNGDNTASGARPYINGNREQSNNFLLDGMDNNQVSDNELGYTPAPDAIEEFNLITNNASAEFGNFEGGIVSATIKSGTNSFHGDVWEFFRNDVLNAKSWSNNFNNLPKDKIRWNMFGGTFGGPIFKNKLFFFADYQGQRFDIPYNVNGYQLFTPRQVAGDFAQICTGGFSAGICNDRDDKGKIIHQLVNPATGASIPFNNLAAVGLTINPVAQAFFNLPAYSAAQAQMNTAVGNGTNFFANGRNALNNDQGDLRIDYNFSDRDRFFGRYSQGHLSNPSVNAFTLGDPGTQVNQPVRNSAVNWTHTFNPTLLNEFRIGFSAVDYNQQANTAGLSNIGEQIGIPGANTFSEGLPLLQFGDFSYGSNALLQIFHTTTGQLADNVILTHGRHTIHAGAQYWRERLDYVYPGNNGLLGTLNISSATNSPLADFWLGRVAGGGQDGGATQFGRRANVYAFFGQDDWRLTNTITLNFGLRFEDHVPYHEIQDREINFGVVDGSLKQASGGNALYDNYLGRGDWQPRIGVAWAPSALGGNTVIRAAYGISSYAEGGGANQLLTKNWPPAFQSSQINSGANIANGFGPASTGCPQPFTLSCFTGKPIKVF